MNWMLLAALILGAPQDDAKLETPEAAPTEVATEDNVAEADLTQPDLTQMSDAAPEPRYQGEPSPYDDAPELSLDEVLQRTRENNIDIRIGQERLAAASYLSIKAWGVLLPTMSASMTGIRNTKDIPLSFGDLGGAIVGILTPVLTDFGVDPSTITVPPPPDVPADQQQWIMKDYQWQANARFDWVLFSGRAIPAVFQAYDIVSVAELGTEQLETTIVSAAELSYYGVLANQRQSELVRRSLASARRQLDLARARAEVGDASDVEVLRAETEVATEEQRLLQADNAARLARLGLVVVMGDELTEEIPMFRVSRPAGRGEDSFDNLYDRALSERLDLKQRDLELNIAELAETEVWMRFLPTLIGSGSLSWTDVKGFIDEQITWNLSLTLSWQFFNGLTDFWETRERQHDVVAASLEVEKTRRDIARQVREARMALDDARANLHAATKRAELARRAAEVIESQYEVGLATQMQVIDANRVRADAETAETLAQLQIDVSRVSLAQVIRVPPMNAGGSAPSGQAGPGAMGGGFGQGGGQGQAPPEQAPPQPPPGSGSPFGP